jgi:nitroreductase
METIDAISKRASTRRYKPEPVARTIVEKLVDAGRCAPTARAVEPWEFIVVFNKEMLSRFGQMASNAPFIKDAACCIVVYCSDTKYYLEDGCAATENILLAAADAGLGACWVAGDKKPYAGEVSELLGVPPDIKLVSIISVGWPEKDIDSTKKRGLKEVIHWEKFQRRK